jgi:hypothetical protein
VCSQLPLADTGASWIWRGYLARSCVTLLSALFKVGKTTFLAHLMRALTEDGEFLARPVRPAKVLYVTEEHSSHWARRRDALGLQDNLHFSVRPFSSKPTHSDWRRFLDRLRRTQEEQRYDLLVLDTIANLWPVCEENNAGEVQAALMPLHHAIGDAALLLVHHLRKSGGTEGTATRGSGALGGFVDVLVEMRRYNAADNSDRRRTLDALGRFDETPPELVVQLGDNGYTVEGDRAGQRQADVARLLLELLPTEPPGMDDEAIDAAWPADQRVRRQDRLGALREGCARVPPLFQREGKGVRGSPHTYWRPQGRSHPAAGAPDGTEGQGSDG